MYEPVIPAGPMTATVRFFLEGIEVLMGWRREEERSKFKGTKRGRPQSKLPRTHNFCVNPRKSSHHARESSKVHKGKRPLKSEWPYDVRPGYGNFPCVCVCTSGPLETG